MKPNVKKNTIAVTSTEGNETETIKQRGLVDDEQRKTLLATKK
jgi:hypothetical protein